MCFIVYKSVNCVYATTYTHLQPDPFTEETIAQDGNTNNTFFTTSNTQHHKFTKCTAHPTHPTIAVVDIQLVLNKTLSDQRIQSQSRKLIEQLQNEIKYHENQLKQLDADMMKKYQSSQDDIENNLSQFNAKLNAAYEIIKNKRSNLEKIQSDSLQKIHTILMELIEKFAKENEIMIVLPKNQTLFADHKLDITPMMLELINKRLGQKEFSVTPNTK